MSGLASLNLIHIFNALSQLQGFLVHDILCFIENGFGLNLDSKTRNILSKDFLSATLKNDPLNFPI